MRVIEIVEDKAGNVWFGTSDGLIKYDGKNL
jgi:ligand-binding sensor domain-containing protein